MLLIAQQTHPHIYFVSAGGAGSEFSVRSQHADLSRSIGVGHADLPGIGVTSKDRYCVALPCHDFIFRDRAYIVADWVNLNNLAVEGGWRCESLSIPFLDGLLTGSQSTFRQPVPHLNRILCEQSRDSSGVALVLGLDKLHVDRFNLLAHFWIDRILLLGKGWQKQSLLSNPARVSSKRIFIVFSRGFRTMSPHRPAAGLLRVAGGAEGTPLVKGP